MKNVSEFAATRRMQADAIEKITPLKPGDWNIPGMLRDDAAEIERLHALINNPHTNDFLEAVRTEAAHQRERWAAEHDAGKADADWFWLVGYLAGKALNAATNVESAEAFKPESSTAWDSWKAHNREKCLHHIITTAAACLNWHAARTGADTRMRPGIAPPI